MDAETDSLRLSDADSLNEGLMLADSDTDSLSDGLRLSETDGDWL